MNRSDRFRLERQLAGQDSHLLGGTAFPRRTEGFGLGLADDDWKSQQRCLGQHHQGITRIEPVAQGGCE